MDINYYRKYEPIFGSWHITDKIGDGTFGQVFAIEREDMGAVYKSALKVITIPQTSGEITSSMSDGMTREEVTEYYEKLVQNIVSEFVLMSKLKGNSNVVSYEDHAVFEHESDIRWDILIRMELLTPLVNLTAESTLAEREIVKLGIDICKALEFCRKYNIVHRDIKPENIFIAPSGDYKIGDFGIAKTVDKTQIGLSRKGTYTYMAPEVYRGEPYGAAIDIYSLGIVMYKLLNNNRTPFLPDYPDSISYSDREEAISRRLKGETIPPMVNGSKKLQKIVLKACSYRAEDRYRKAGEMRRELEGLLHYGNPKIIETSLTESETGQAEEQKHIDKTVVARRKSIRKRLLRTRKQKRMAAILAVILAMVGAGFAVAPKNVTAVEGISNKNTVLFEETCEPEYTIKPWYFANSELTFTVENEDIADVSDEGKITAKSVGTTSLIIRAGDYKRQVLINVIPKVTDISNVSESIELVTGESRNLKPKLLPEKYANEKILYESSDSSIVSVSKAGKITAKAAGTAEVTIRAGGREQSVNVTVTSPVIQSPSSVRGKTTGSSSSGSGSSRSSSSGNGSSRSRNSNTGDGGDFFDSDDDEFF